MLRLGRNKLVGKIPVELGILTNLQVLGLDYNNLTGGLSSIANLSSLSKLYLSGQSFPGTGPGFEVPIPDFVGKFKGLSILALGGSGFIGTIPASLYNLSSLQIFSLNSNQLWGSLPSNLGLYFPKLQWLQIGDNQLTGGVPISLSNLSNVELIDISLNNFSGKFLFDGRNTPYLSFLQLNYANLGTGGAEDLHFLDTLTNCSQLDILDFRNNYFGGFLPPSLANLSTTTRWLLLANNQIAGSIPSGLGNILNLQILDISGNQFTGTFPADIGGIPRLQKAYYSSNKLSGIIPPSFGNLSWLSELDLSVNLLEGTIPSTLGNCKNFLILDLSQNNLVGNVPHQLFLASKLYNLYLDNNHLQGSLPSEISELKSLLSLDVSNNNISGTLPSSLGQCVGITKLYLHGNLFNGSIPPSFSLLKSLQFIDLSSNKLSGQIPKYFSNFSSLKLLNLSFNNLEGEVPTGGIFSNRSGVSFVGNNKLCGGIPELLLPKCTVEQSKARKLSAALKVIISMSCVLVGLVTVSSLCLFYSRKKKRSSSRSLSIREPFIKASYDMLLKATNGFSAINLIGTGGFGSVYRGTLLQDGAQKEVAIKVINIQRQGAGKSFMAECEALRIIRHRNLVGIITACSSIDFQGNEFKALVYEFMPNGSLEKWLYSDQECEQFQNLNLLQRVNVALDVAHALDYIHNDCGTRIVHCDLKPTNILLDENMTAHVGDFGLAKLLPEFSEQLHNSTSVGIRGTLGYTAPEYGQGAAASAAGDVYSYGILLIEMMTAKRPTDLIFEGDLNLYKFAKSALPDHFMEILDPRLKVDEDGDEIHPDMNDAREVKDYVIECIKAVINLGVVCSSDSPQDRMDIKDVISQLQSARTLLQSSFRNVSRMHIRGT